MATDSENPGGAGPGPDSARLTDLLTGLFLTPGTYSDEVTQGAWADEASSAAELDKRVEGTGCFRVYREVPGVYLHPRPGTDACRKTCRIDRVLVPTVRLREAGWKHGAVGVEIEASGQKIGAPLSQLLDYTRALWTLKDGFRVYLDWLALWPWPGSKGNVARIACQNRICGAYYTNNLRFMLTDGARIGLSCGVGGAVSARGFLSGTKSGHREGDRHDCSSNA